MFRSAHLAPIPNQPFNPGALYLLIGLYLLFGLFGFDPWRGGDATHFGPIYSMLQGHGVLFPEIAREPLYGFPPLYYWTGAAFAYLTSGFLSVHSGARLASAFFTALAIFFIARGTEWLHGRQERTAAALLTLGVLGLVIEAHQIQPMLAVMAMYALALSGFARVAAEPVKGALTAGLGSGLCFLAGGLIGAAITLPLFLLLMLFSRECRNPTTLSALLAGLCLAVTLMVVWPLAVHLSSPKLFQHWLGAQIAPLLQGPLSMHRLPLFIEETAWMMWPLWPLALWGLWQARRKLVSVAWLLPSAAVVVVLVWLVLQGDARTPLILLLIPPLALLAVGGVPSLRRGAANAFDWFAVMTFGVFALLVWLGWTAQVFAWPRGLARHIARVAPDYHFSGDMLPALIGVVVCLVWLAAVVRQPRSRARGAANWAMGMTMLWCLAVLLLQPWFNHNRGYKDMAQDLDRYLNNVPEANCIASMDMADALRSSLYYFANVRTYDASNGITPCSRLIIHGDRGEEPATPASQWQLVWSYTRGGDNQLETLNLYSRSTSP